MRCFGNPIVYGFIFYNILYSIMEIFSLIHRCRYVMGHGVGPYIGLNDIGSPSPMKTFITINYLFNFIFGFII